MRLQIKPIEEFTEGLKGWKIKLQQDEWYFATLREQITSGLKPNEAFDLIPAVVELVLIQDTEFQSSESFQLLLDLVRRSGTTEVSPALDVKWDLLSHHMLQFSDYHKEQLVQLERWYRRNTH